MNLTAEQEQALRTLLSAGMTASKVKFEEFVKETREEIQELEQQIEEQREAFEADIIYVRGIEQADTISEAYEEYNSLRKRKNRAEVKIREHLQLLEVLGITLM